MHKKRRKISRAGLGASGREAKRKKSDSNKPAPSGTVKASGKKPRKAKASPTYQTAVDLLLKASAEARARRQAAGEESEEEALLPDLPPARPGLGEDTGQTTDDPVCAAPLSDLDLEGEEEELCSDQEEPVLEEAAAARRSRAAQHEGRERDDEEDDFFDIAEEEATPTPDPCRATSFCFGFCGSHGL